MPPSYGQLYIYDNSEALQFRLNQPANVDCRPDVMRTISEVIERENPFAAAYKHMYEVEREELLNAEINNRPASKVYMTMKTGSDRRRYNMPHFEEVAAVFVGVDGEPPAHRDIVVYSRAEDAGLRNISTLSANLDPLMYPIFFPRGDCGWHINMRHVEERATARRTKLTMLQYYTYRLAVRNTFNPLLKGKKLSQQFDVDAYCRVEGERLEFIRQNQVNLRVEHYQGLHDHVQRRAQERGLQPGREVVLPSTFPGSPRAMQQNYADAMAIIGKYHKPDIFLTITCNPKWREIVENLGPNEKAFDRPDLISRVFNMKLRALLDDINKKSVLGRTVAHVYVVEYQKRGLPHAHILINFSDDDKLIDS